MKPEKLWTSLMTPLTVESSLAREYCLLSISGLKHQQSDLSLSELDLPEEERFPLYLVCWIERVITLGHLTLLHVSHRPQQVLVARLLGVPELRSQV